MKPGIPYFITCNHPAGFLEPLLLACFLDRDLHFLVRGDLFYNPILKPLLIATNQIPIFRIRDGFSNLRHNTETVETVFTKLNEKKAILIFIEGSTQMVKRLRPLQKGMARMTFRAMEENPELQPQILPIGMSFTDLIAFREEVIIKIHPPLKAGDYISIYKKNKSKAITKLTEDTFQAMRSCMVDVPEKKEELYEVLSKVKRSGISIPFLPVFTQQMERIDDEITFADQVKMIPAENAGSLKKSALSWLSEFSSIKCRGNILLLIPAVFGYLFNALPAMAGVWFADSKIKNMAFYGPIRMVVALVAFLVYYLVISIVCLVIDPLLLIVPVIFAFLGITYLYYRHTLQEKKKKEMPSDLRNKRVQILESIPGR